MSSEQILDVRENDEFAAEYIEGSVQVPLSQFAALAPGVLRGMAGKSVLIMCRSGMRAKLAQTQIEQLGFGNSLRTEVYQGGILEWKKQGRPVVTRKKSHLPIMRQVQLIAGLSVLISVLLSHWVNQSFVWIAAFFGSGLTLAGATGFCGLAQLLAQMPWNKAVPGVKAELCQVSPRNVLGGESDCGGSSQN